MSVAPSREHAKTAVTWIGLSTLGFWLLLTLDVLAHAPELATPRTSLYLAALALIGSALGSVPIALLHLTRLLPGRIRTRAALCVLVLLGLGTLPALNELSHFLVAGAWVSTLPYVRALRVGLVVFAFAGVEALLLWHAFGTSAELRAAIGRRWGAKVARLCELAFWPAGCGVLLLVFLTLGGLLRPYGMLAAQLLYPCWLISATLAFRLAVGCTRTRLALAGAMPVLGLASAVLPLIDPVRYVEVGSAMFDTQGFAALTEARLAHEHPAEQFDFGRASGKRCAQARKPPRLALAKEQRRNVILISMDALRRDVIGKRIGGQSVAPHVETFASESVFFARAATPASFTIAAVGSAFSGRSLGQLVWMSSIPKNIFTRTPKLFRREQVVVPDWNFLRSSSFHQLVLQGAATRFVPRDQDPGQPFIDALQRARERGERGLFWLHVVDPHSPYKHADHRFGDGRPALYHGEVAIDDAILGRVFEYLRGSGYYDDSLIIFFSDHGESLGEKDGYFGHGVSNAGRLGDVPLLVHYPGVQPRVSNAAVSITSIAPTVWHYLNQSIPGAVSACSLLLPEAALAACPKPISELFGSGLETFDKIITNPLHTREQLDARQRSVKRWQRFPPEVTAVSSEHRYLRNLQSGVEHVYPRGAEERDDLIGERPDLLRAFRNDVAKWQRDEAERLVCQLSE